MTTTQDPIAHASRLLREAAEELRQAHAYNNSEGWENETDAKAAYDEHMAAAQALEDWEAAVGAGGVQPLRSVQEGCKLVPLEPTQEMLAALMSPGEAEVLASSPSETFALMLMDRAGIRERYSAMLAASPTPPAEHQAAPKAAPWEWTEQDALGILNQLSDGPFGQGDVDDALDFMRLVDTARRDKAAPVDALDEVMRERDEAEDFINELLDEVLGADRPEWSSAYNRYDAMSDVRERITALHKPAVDKAWGQFQSAMAAPQQEAQEPTTIDQKTMELAESVGLIGPASRIGDLHAAIQRFHDLICVNATIKAAVMAADVISGVATPARDYPPLPMQFACSGVFPVYSADQMRAYVDADRAAYAPGSSQPAPAPLSDDVVRDAAFDAVRKKLCALPRFSFLSDGYGVRRVPDKSGSWIAFDAAHAMFDPVAVDAALATHGGE